MVDMALAFLSSGAAREVALDVGVLRSTMNSVGSSTSRNEVSGSGMKKPGVWTALVGHRIAR